MPISNNRSSTSRRSGSRPSAPSYNRRSSSARRDIRMDNRRRRNNQPNWGMILLVLGIIVAIVLAFIVIGSGQETPINTPTEPDSTGKNTSPTEGIQLPDTYTPPAVITEPPSTEDVLIYTDDRVPNYKQTNPRWETLRYEWARQDNRGTMWIEISIDAEMYSYYSSLTRYHGIENYYNYIVDSNNRAIIKQIVDVIRDVADELSYSDAAVAREVAKFVQDVIEYQYDSDTTGEDEYPRYPIETLYERQGDCEDTSILMAALLKELGYEVGFLHVPGHVAVALRTADNYEGGAYYEINGHRYLFIESTGSGWNIGDIPEEFQNAQATFFLIP